MNLRDQALDGIRKLIFSGELRTGVKTSEREIAEKLHISRTPVREALAILSEFGMVDQYPQVGVAVREVALDEALEILRIRAGVEGVVVEELTSQKNSRISEELRVIADDMEATKDVERFMVADTSFHCEMARLAGFATAVNTIRSLRDRLHLFRLTRLPLTPEEMEPIVKEHQAIVDAISSSSSTEEPVNVLRKHFMSTQARFSKYASESIEAIEAAAAEAGIQEEVHQLLAAAERRGLRVRPRSRNVVTFENPQAYVLCEFRLLPGKIHLHRTDGFVHQLPVTDGEVTRFLGPIRDLSSPDVIKFVKGLDELFEQVEIRKKSMTAG
jgi:DNA-binding GntR family transcriptional regulator